MVRRDLPAAISADGSTVVALAELAEFITKGTTPTTLGFDWVESGVRFLRSECVSERGFNLQGSQFISVEAHAALARSAVIAGDILVTITGNVGRVAVVPDDIEVANINQHIARVRISRPNTTDVRYVAHVLGSRPYREQFARIVTGLAYPQLSLQQVRETAVVLPPLPEQRKIAAILSSVDETIEKTEAVVAQLQVVKKAMMQELLTRGMPGRHTRFKQTEIGEIPEGWDLATVGTVCATKSGGTPDRQRAEFWNGSIPWVKTGEVNYSTIMATEEHITEAAIRASSAQVFPAGTVIMAMYGQGATRGRVADLGIDAATNQACLALLPGPRVLGRFLFHSLSNRYDELRGIGNEGSQKNLNAALVRSVLIPLPPLAEQREIVSCVDAVDARSDGERAVLARLMDTKIALSAALLSGDVRVTPDKDAI